MGAVVIQGDLAGQAAGTRVGEGAVAAHARAGDLDRFVAEGSTRDRKGCDIADFGVRGGSAVGAAQGRGVGRYQGARLDEGLAGVGVGAVQGEAAGGGLGHRTWAGDDRARSLSATAVDGQATGGGSDGARGLVDGAGGQGDGVGVANVDFVADAERAG